MRRILAVCLVFVLLPCSFAFASDVSPIPTMPPLDAPITDVGAFYSRVFAMSYGFQLNFVNLITQSIDGKLSLNFNVTAPPIDPTKDYLRNCFSMVLDTIEALSFYPGYDNIYFLFSTGLVSNPMYDTIITMRYDRDTISQMEIDYYRVGMYGNPMLFANAADSLYIHPAYRIDK